MSKTKCPHDNADEYFDRCADCGTGMSDQREAILTASLKRLAAIRDKAQAVGDQGLWWQTVCYMQTLLDNDYRERKAER